VHYFYISGTSRGIGKALAEKLLDNEENYVIGFSRTNSIKNERYEFIPVDLSIPDNAINFRFIPIIDAESITLVNNSGILGHVEHIGNLNNQSIIESFNVNVVSPAILMNNFVKAYQNNSCRRMVVNISSGAARRAIGSWSIYCSGKSALDMYSSVAKIDQDIVKPASPIRFFSVAPGIVDTQMQKEIRGIDSNSFSEVEKFISYKSNNKLSSPDEVALKLVQLMENANKISSSILDLRDLDF